MAIMELQYISSDEAWDFMLGDMKKTSSLFMILWTDHLQLLRQVLLYLVSFVTLLCSYAPDPYAGFNYDPDLDRELAPATSTSSPLAGLDLYASFDPDPNPNFEWT
jgi:hypothetical protein